MRPRPHHEQWMRRALTVASASGEDVPVGAVLYDADGTELAVAGNEREATGDVVVVDVGLGDVGDAHPELVDQGEDPVDVALRVDDEGDLAVVGEVAAVAEAGGGDRADVDHQYSLPGRVSTVQTGTRCARVLVVRPGTGRVVRARRR